MCKTTLIECGEVCPEKLIEEMKIDSEGEKTRRRWFARVKLLRGAFRRTYPLFKIS
jgi:hypothetical protein